MNERALVERGPEAKRRLMLECLGIFTVGLGAVLAYQWFHDHWAGVLLMLVIGMIIGRGSMMPFERAAAYRSGWLDGRSRMVRNLPVRGQVGRTARDWLQTELEHDALNVMGMPIARTPDKYDEDDA